MENIVSSLTSYIHLNIRVIYIISYQMLYTIEFQLNCTFTAVQHFRIALSNLIMHIYYVHDHDATLSCSQYLLRFLYQSLWKLCSLPTYIRNILAAYVLQKYVFSYHPVENQDEKNIKRIREGSFIHLVTLSSSKQLPMGGRKCDKVPR